MMPLAFLAGLLALMVFGQASQASSLTDTLLDDAQTFGATCSRTWNAHCEAEAIRLNDVLREATNRLLPYSSSDIIIPVPYSDTYILKIKEKINSLEKDYHKHCTQGWAIGCGDIGPTKQIWEISEHIANGMMLGQPQREAWIAAEKAAEDKRVADAKAAEEARVKQLAEKAEAARAAEERRIEREQAREQRQWTLIVVVGGGLVALLGLFFALRAAGANVSLSEWSRSFYWLVRAAVAVTFALFFLTTVETFFGALSIPDWMRRPLADMLDKASDAIDPDGKETVK